MQHSVGFIFGLLLAAAVSLQAQDAVHPVARGDSLHRQLCFEDALQAYLSAAGDLPPGLRQEDVERRISASQNALNMMEFCADPIVVARQRFARKDFFLYYPLKAQGWRPSPNVLDSAALFPTYAPKEADVIYYSAADRAGTRSLFVTEDTDSLWRAPRLAGEALLSTGSEIFPMLSPDEKTLYFASDGLYGMGGYDLYASAWDDETGAWGAPVNLGFPFNSPADDFLLMDTEDGQYTLFASNRACGPDSVYVYVLDFASSRQRKPVRNLQELQRITQLTPVSDPIRMDTAATAPEQPFENAGTRLYRRKMAEARMLRDSIARCEDRPERALYFRELLEEVNLEIKLVEQNFLESGVASSAGAAEREVVGAHLGYTFSKHAMGPKLKLALAPQTATPSFRVMPVGRIAQDAALPPGVVYQIEFLTSPRHVSLDDIAGLSPVYERLTSSLRYTYSVGLYARYADALLDLNTVRCLGFPSARIVAYRDGRPISVRTALQEE